MGLWAVVVTGMWKNGKGKEEGEIGKRARVFGDPELVVLFVTLDTKVDEVECTVCQSKSVDDGPRRKTGESSCACKLGNNCLSAWVTLERNGLRIA